MLARRSLSNATTGLDTAPDNPRFQFWLLPSNPTHKLHTSSATLNEADALATRAVLPYS